MADEPLLPGIEPVAEADSTPEPVTQLAAASPRPPPVARPIPEPIAAPPAPAPDAAPRVATSTPKVEPTPVPAPQPTAQPKPEPRARKVVRSPVPDLVVERTIWHPVPERRVAVVALEGSEEPIRLHQGDAVGPLVVKEIEPSAVLFGHEGVELRRGVGAR